MTHENQSPAFPFTEMHTHGTPYTQWKGMDLRDYFAAKAMQSQMLNTKEMDYWAQDYSVNEMWIFCAKNAYRMADAMLEARKK